MKKHKLISSLGSIWITTILLFSLSACDTASQTVEKKPFFITTETINGSGTGIAIVKQWKIVGDQSIIVTSQVSGRVKNIKSKIGKQVAEGDTIIQMSDDIANYALQVKRAKTALNNAILSYNQSKINIDSSISSAQNQLSQSEQNFLASKKSAEQSLQQAMQTVNNAWLQDGSPTALNIEQIVTNVENQITNIKKQYALQINQIDDLLTDVLYQEDMLLWVTQKYKQFNSKYYTYLWAKDISQKQSTESMIWALYRLQKELQWLNTENVSNKDLIASVDRIDNIYKQIDTSLQSIIIVLNNSVAGVNLTKTQISNFTTIFNGLQTRSQTSRAGFVAYQNQLNALLWNIAIDSSLSETDIVNTIAKQQIKIALTQAKEQEKSAKIALESTKINTKNAISNNQIALKNAQINYSSKTQNKNNQIGLLANNITQARINYQDMLDLYNKLTVKSPIEGSIGDVFVDKGQEIHPWTPLFSVVSDQDPMIEIFVTTKEHDMIHIGQTVNISYNNTSLTGEVISISDVATANMLYKIQIKLDHPVDLLWDVASVQIPIQVDKLLLPLQSVTALQEGKGFIYLLKDNQPERFDVELGQVWEDKIEILNSLPQNSTIISSDISNYNPEKFQFTLQP